MPIQINFARTSPESDPTFNEKTRKISMDYYGKRDALLKKHGIKDLGSYLVPIEHLAISILEAESLDAFQKLMMEPEFMAELAFGTWETKIGVRPEDLLKMLK